jgi:hypothetical protein
MSKLNCTFCDLNNVTLGFREKCSQFHRARISAIFLETEMVFQSSAKGVLKDPWLSVAILC